MSRLSQDMTTHKPDGAPPAFPCCSVAGGACLASTAVLEPAPTTPTSRPAPASAEPDPFPPDQLDPWDAEAPPELWPDECDADVWVPNEAEGDTDEAATLDMAGLVSRHADAYRAWPIDAGRMIGMRHTNPILHGLVRSP
jgi:hypothetical protein